MESAEWIPTLVTARLGENDPLVLDGVGQFITRFQTQHGANGLGNGGLRFGRQFAGDHDEIRNILGAGQRKEILFLRQ